MIIFSKASPSNLLHASYCQLSNHSIHHGKIQYNVSAKCYSPNHWFFFIPSVSCYCLPPRRNTGKYVLGQIHARENNSTPSLRLASSKWFLVASTVLQSLVKSQLFKRSISDKLSHQIYTHEIYQQVKNYTSI